MVFHVAQISDTHLSRDKPFFVDNFHRIVESLAADAPDLVINTGDISLDGAEREDDLAAARQLHGSLSIPVRFLPGNHDLGDNVGVASGHGHAIDAERRARYLRYFGDDWWWFDVPGWRMIGVNAQLLGSDLAAEDKQQTFLARTVAGAKQQRIALFIHKPVFDQDPGEQVIGGRFLDPLPRRRLLTAFVAGLPSLIASGHVHQYRTSVSDGALCVWSPSTAFYLPDSYQPRYGVKQVGYVSHRFHASGEHDCRFVSAPGTENLCLADVPGAYGPLP
jgi:3',5'-cyclic AMP phosphodiesterase CpdA